MTRPFLELYEDQMKTAEADRLLKNPDIDGEDKEPGFDSLE
jgi:hypothetical protein